MNIAASGSAMKISITRHDITAHDVANINTPGFEERTAHQAEISDEGVRISHISRKANQSPGGSNTSLVEESKEQIQNKNTFSANAKVIKAKDRMIGELMDLFG
ncbi:MAG: hypothetical protein GF350_10740 [Chitinivibrionales bacterium]|nr:hypothetical protein [Chitinivibrionales bacterium]